MTRETRSVSLWRSSKGMPSMAHMDAAGTAKARSATRSIAPNGATRSSSATARRSIIGRMVLRALGVKALLTRLRKRS